MGGGQTSQIAEQDLPLRRRDPKAGIAQAPRLSDGETRIARVGSGQMSQLTDDTLPLRRPGGDGEAGQAHRVRKGDVRIARVGGGQTSQLADDALLPDVSGHIGQVHRMRQGDVRIARVVTTQNTKSATSCVYLPSAHATDEWNSASDVSQLLNRRGITWLTLIGVDCSQENIPDRAGRHVRGHAVDLVTEAILTTDP
jgi:hypothetical protein